MNNESVQDKQLSLQQQAQTADKRKRSTTHRRDIQRELDQASAHTRTDRRHPAFFIERQRRLRLNINYKDKILLGLAAFFALAITLRGAEAQTLDATTLDSFESGGMLMIGDAAQQQHRATTLDSTVRMRVTGLMAAVEVEQRFVNQAEYWVEGVYAFPLPENAAVNRMTMRVGSRLIEGQIKEKEEAVRSYQAAREAGQSAALVTQQRPNLFTSRVANLAPGEVIEVSISYVQQLDYRDGAFSLRFPMTMTPRYRGAETDPIEYETTAAHPVIEPDLTQNPMAPSHAQMPNVQLQVHLQPGFDLVRLESRHHDIDIAESNGLYLINLLNGGQAADRDFELVWEPSLSNAPKAALFSESFAGEDYALLMIMPPQQPYPHHQPRELILVIDTSGSMQGASLRQAQESLLMALGTLHPEDRFNVIEFNSSPHALFQRAQAASASAIVRAEKFIQQLSADGGTEMASALHMALDGAPPAKFVRQVVFVTDGSVGNETQLFRQIEQELGRSRLFTVGIGAAPNGYFMRKAAQFGRGSFTFIGSVGEVTEKMDALLSQLEYPMLTDVCIDWPSYVEAYPMQMPDLYLGEPLIVSAKMDRLKGAMEVCGNTASSGWNQQLALKGDTPESGIATLWARRKIGYLMDELALGSDPDLIRTQVTDVALTHSLSSRYTSFVAIDQTPKRELEELRQVRLAHAAPAVAEVEAADYTSPQNLMAAPRTVSLALPQTSTDSMLRITVGLMLLILAGIFMLRLRDQQ